MKKVLVPLAPGFEEIEAITVIDVLRRAGVEVTAAGTQAGPIEASRGVKVMPDAKLDDLQADQFDMIVLPGGAKGAENLQRNPKLQAMVGDFFAKNKPVGAICAAPSLLAAAGLICGKQVTSHPSVKQIVAAASIYSEQRVVTDGNLVTSRGPGTALEFALKLVELLAGKEKAAEIRTATLAQEPAAAAPSSLPKEDSSQVPLTGP